MMMKHTKFPVLKQSDEIEEDEMAKTQKLYTPHRDALIITTTDPSKKIELMYYQADNKENLSTQV